ncbi:hypothetical protein PG994_008975 [Apiospora phragmitis]|uniref:Uncharacterized protein n=1 Tax=Apiospora phragmitis TaxID=2905665 RepID=A0ABR1UHZ1_9PEZI
MITAPSPCCMNHARRSWLDISSKIWRGRVDLAVGCMCGLSALLVKPAASHVHDMASTVHHQVAHQPYRNIGHSRRPQICPSDPQSVQLLLLSHAKCGSAGYAMYQVPHVNRGPGASKQILRIAGRWSLVGRDDWVAVPVVSKRLQCIFIVHEGIQPHRFPDSNMPICQSSDHLKALLNRPDRCDLFPLAMPRLALAERCDDLIWLPPVKEDPLKSVEKDYTNGAVMRTAASIRRSTRGGCVVAVADEKSDSQLLRRQSTPVRAHTHMTRRTPTSRLGIRVPSQRGDLG